LFSDFIYTILLSNDDHYYIMDNIKCDSCKRTVHSPNPFLDSFVCDKCYHELISKVYYPNSIEV